MHLAPQSALEIRMKMFLFAGVAALALGTALNWDRLPSKSDYDTMHAAYTNAPTAHAGVGTNSAR